MNQKMLDENSTHVFSGDNYLVSSSANKELYKFKDKGKYLQMIKKANIDLMFCQMDDKSKVLNAD